MTDNMTTEDMTMARINSLLADLPLARPYSGDSIMEAKEHLCTELLAEHARIVALRAVDATPRSNADRRAAAHARFVARQRLA